MSLLSTALMASAALALGLPASAKTGEGPMPGVYPVSGFGSGPLRSGATGLDLVIDVGGIPSYAGLDNPGNNYLTFSVTPGALVDLIAWNVNLTAYAPSWLSEITAQFSNSAGDGIGLRPGTGVTGSGTLTLFGITAAVPEPGNWALMAAALLTIGDWARRRRA